MKIKIKKLRETAVLPTRGSEYAAGYDLRANIDSAVVVNPHETVKIGTGLAMELPIGYAGFIFARSGLATKQGLRPANCVGLCDCDYRGEYIVAIHNDSDAAKIVEPNDKIAQLVVLKTEALDFDLVEELDNTDRGTNGFGSTGK